MHLQFQYRPLCTLVLRHAYYGSGVGSDFYLRPTPETAKLAKAAGMVIKQTGLGLQIAVDTSARERLDFHWLGTQARLSFFLYTNNPYFINITEVPFQMDLIWLLSNQKGLKNQEKGMLLHPKEFVGADSSVPRVGSQFTLEGLSEAAGQATIRRPDSATPLRSVVFDGKRLDVPFGGLPIGGYVVKFGKQERQVAYVGPSILPHPIGLVELYPTPELRQQAESPTDGGIVYTLAMSSRQTYWQYVVVRKHWPTLDGLFITGGNAFQLKGKRQVNGEEAVVFESSKSLPLMERQPTVFQLKSKQGNGPERLMVNHLPIASPKQIRVEAEKLYSEIFVYL